MPLPFPAHHALERDVSGTQFMDVSKTGLFARGLPSAGIPKILHDQPQFKANAYLARQRSSLFASERRHAAWQPRLPGAVASNGDLRVGHGEVPSYLRRVKEDIRTEHTMNASSIFRKSITGQPARPFGCCCYGVRPDFRRPGVGLIPVHPMEISQQATSSGSLPDTEAATWRLLLASQRA